MLHVSEDGSRLDILNPSERMNNAKSLIGRGRLFMDLIHQAVS